MIERINSPAELRNLGDGELPGLCEELRRTIIERVAENGGHLASNCGTVELTVALHRVFNTPADRIFFDVGHQAYAHKIITGRREKFKELRRYGGISGFPTPEESSFDPAPAGHAGSALSVASGFAAAVPEDPSRLIVVIGDGSIGCGVNFEALNHIANNPGKRRIILILNDNQMSISSNVGALATYFNRVISGKTYNRFRLSFKRKLRRLPKLFHFVRSLVYSAKSALLPKGNFFEALGFRYLGPVDGHDLSGLIRVFERVNKLDGPLVLHVVTRKGFGCRFAEDDPTRYHGIGKCDPDTGMLPEGGKGFSRALGEALINLSEKNPDLVAVTAAMGEGTGLAGFAKRFPERYFDVGIAEEHALSFSCGLAASGKAVVCAFYDTFLQRALDQIYHDAVLAKLPLILAVDRAGAVEDGPTHHGIYNCGFLRALPGITVCAPAQVSELESFLEMALLQNSPVVIRYPRGGTPDIPLPSGAKEIRYGKAAVIKQHDGDEAVLWSFGAELVSAMQCAEILSGANISVTVADARFLKPFDRELALRLAELPHFTIENHVLCGGLYSALCEALAGVPHGAICGFGWPDDKIVAHGEIDRLRSDAGLDAKMIASAIAGSLGKTI